MLHFLKKLIAISLCLCMLFALAVVAHANTGNEVKAAKKIISVVYDDTGSMFSEGEDRVSYANYAMQSLIALLNPQDELYITFMSKEAAQRFDASAVESSVETIRTWGEQGATLYSNVDIAYNAIEGISAEPSDQFWLFTFTDGEMYEDLDKLEEDIPIEKTTLQTNFRNFANKTMNNGTSLNVVYLAVGKDALKLDDDKSIGLYTFSSDSGESIRNSVNEIAGLISGRMDCENVKSIDDKTIGFTLPLPAVSISVLSHNSQAVVTSAGAEGIGLNVERNIRLDTSDTPYAQADLKGNASSLNYTDAGGFKKSISKGDYQIEFSDSVKAEDVLIQYEPAIGLKLTVSKDGVEVGDTATLQSGDKVDIDITPVVSGTSEVIPDADLPTNTTWKTEYRVDGDAKKSSDGKQLKDVELELGDNMVIGTMFIPGYAPLVYELNFDIAEIIYHLGIETVQPDDPVFKRSKLGEKGINDTNEIRFYLTNDGQRMTKEDIDKGGIRLKTEDIELENGGFGFSKGSFTFRLNDDGSFTLVPNQTGPLGAGWFNGFIKTGDYHITVYPDRDNSVRTTAHFSINGSVWETIIPLIIIFIILVLLAYIIFLLVKPKFKTQLLTVETYRPDNDNSVGIYKSDMDDTIRLKKFGCHLFSLSSACYAEYNGFKIVATRSDGPIITGPSIIKAADSYVATTKNAVSEYFQIEAQMTKTKDSNGNYRETVDVYLERNPLCYKANEYDTIHRICTAIFLYRN